MPQFGGSVAFHAIVFLTRPFGWKTVQSVPARRELPGQLLGG